MINEISWSIDDINSGEWVRKDTNKVSEQDVKRSQVDAAKAKKVWEQIKKNKQENNDIANFLSFLLKSIKNEDIIYAIYNTFFKVVDNKTKTSYLRKSINNIVVIWFFAPFFPKELEKFKLSWYFQDFCKLDGNVGGLNEYISYIKNLSRKYHDNVPINQSSLLNLLILIIWEFWLSKETLDEAWKEKIKRELLAKLK